MTYRGRNLLPVGCEAKCYRPRAVDRGRDTGERAAVVARGREDGLRVSEAASVVVAASQ